MKIAFTSDTHYTITTELQLINLAHNIAKQKPDILIHGGDVGEVLISNENFAKVLEILTLNNTELMLVAGNHDLWKKPIDHTNSKQMWEHYIPEMCQQNNWHYLEKINWNKNGIAIVGSYLHYEYSAQDHKGTVENYITTHTNWTTDQFYEKQKKMVNNDANYLIGLPTDKKFANIIGESFKKRLLEAQNDEKIHTIVIVTHLPCLSCQISRKPNDFNWSLSTPYFGNLSHEELILNCSKVKCVLSGHAHQANETIIKINDRNINAVVIGSDYRKPLFEIFEI